MMMVSLITALVIAVGKIAISLLSAFAVVYFRFPLRNVVFWMIFVTLMLPVEVRILPTYKVVSDLGMLNTYGIYGRDTFKNTATTRNDVNFWLLGASVDLGLGTLTANYMERDVQKDKSGTLKKLQAGYSYKLSKLTSVFALYDRDDPNSNASNDVIRNFSVGIQKNF